MAPAGNTAAALAPESLTLSINSFDLTEYPSASATVQLGGDLAPSLGALTSDAFSVEVDGMPAPITSVEEAQAETALPVQTVLLIDESGSMKGEAIKAAAEAAASFIKTMSPTDTAAVQAFNEGFRTLQGFTSDQTALVASLNKLNPQKETALYDALLKSFSSFGLAPSGGVSPATTGPSAIGARYLILLSDGGDTVSLAKLEEVMTVARASGVQVYAVGLKTKEFDSQPLVSIAEATGGRYLETPDPETLTSLYKTLAKEIHNQYVLTFDMPAGKQASQAGRLVVAVRTGAGTAQAERGFIYPETSSTGETATPTSTTLVVPTTEVVASVPESGLIQRFLDWDYSRYVMGVVIFALVFVFFYLISGVIFPKRNVLAEYSDLLEHRRNLGPRALDEEQGRQKLHTRIVQRFLALRGYQLPLQKMIDDANLKFRASEFALIHLVGVVVVVVAASLLKAPIILVVVLALLVVFLPLLWLNSKARSRRQAFEEQVPNTLTLLAGSLRAGQGLEQAIATVASEAPEPTASEFRKIIAQQRLGIAPEDALRAIAEDMKSEAFDWAVMVTIIQRQVGGNLAEIYESIAATLRERAKLRRDIRTLTAEGRISAIILIVLPFAIGAFVAVFNRTYLSLLYTTVAGWVMLSVAFVLLVIGIFWMRAITRVNV
ncbi:MAG: VWA domain-containing protein [Thermoleophilia bacterium]|nr:VWA domain-containing protein [Thermoleophilia bacterium]